MIGPDVTQELTDLERRGWEALAGGRGRDFYDEILLDDGLMVFPVGVFGKADALRGIASAPPWSRFELGDIRVMRLTDESATIVYRVEAERPGQPLYRAFMSSTYVRRDGTWPLALHTQTPIAGS